MKTRWKNWRPFKWSVFKKYFEQFSTLWTINKDQNCTSNKKKIKWFLLEQTLWLDKPAENPRLHENKKFNQIFVLKKILNCYQNGWLWIDYPGQEWSLRLQDPAKNEQSQLQVSKPSENHSNIHRSQKDSNEKTSINFFFLYQNFSSVYTQIFMRFFLTLFFCLFYFNCFNFFRAADWNLNEPTWSGRLRWVLDFVFWVILRVLERFVNLYGFC